MKIKQSDFNELAAQFASWKERFSIDLPFESNRYKNLCHTPKRFRWDCLYALPLSFRVLWFERVYKYANDEHIDTILKKLVCNDKWEII